MLDVFNCGGAVGGLTVDGSASMKDVTATSVTSFGKSFHYTSGCYKKKRPVNPILLPSLMQGS